MTDRREFLRKLAKGTAYVAPAIYTMSTPRDLMAFETSEMTMMEMMGMLVAFPWSVPPSQQPTTALPGGGLPGSSGGGSGSGN